MVAVLSLLAGCGDLPQPFAGHPGALALRLAQPPPARLAVPVPTNALLTEAASAAYDEALVAALQDQEVPAVAETVRKGDWKLLATAELRGSQVVPTFTVLDPAGKNQGSTEVPPLDAAAWADGGKQTLQSAAAAGGARPIAALLTRIEATRRQSDPNSLLNRPARVVVNEVVGAPGDGNHQLARNLRLQLPQVGEDVRETTAGADFVVQGDVKTAAESGGERIEIRWIVRDMQGRELGQIVQLNEVAPGSLDRYWGDTAMVVGPAGGRRHPRRDPEPARPPRFRAPGNGQAGGRDPAVTPAGERALVRMAAESPGQARR